MARSLKFAVFFAKFALAVGIPNMVIVCYEHKRVLIVISEQAHTDEHGSVHTS
jgi:hypothetical protein